MKSDRELRDLLRPDPQTARVYDQYRRLMDVYRRASVAMGRIPKYKVTLATTQSVDFPNASHRKT